ncbi:Potassium-transporting ATPase ATP-binding subunit [Candidatus Lokiarchaeum ossiferum]|uniref:Potassium-transporting ATPase ATP-binding subunit n=1 Tax=Candidatus Lokiarchaeum ossiferum TaxID=2951803 RepID=A0ABY6HNT4_9ARCH|nr:Potassium-transporting ATPase ATP-binding subunit [Candidatus Lokiarchaeum sp. B-35]
MPKTPYCSTIDELFTELHSQKGGLSTGEAQTIKAQVGDNEIPKKKVGLFQKYIKPSINFMTIILLLAALLQLYFVFYFEGSPVSPITIIVIVLFNVIVAISQQFRAEKTIEALEKLTAYKATILRDGFTTEVETNDLVPGDIMILNQGAYISADARVIESNELSIDESNLTGESAPVLKKTASLESENVQIQEQNNMLFNSTFVNSGSGKAIVTAIGVETEIGKIAKGIAQNDQRDIPLTKMMNKLAMGLGIFVIFVISLLFIVKSINGIENIQEEISWLIFIAIAAIPINFPLITALVLLSGVIKLSRNQAIVRNLSAVETMGRLNIICSDKTGTLTQNEMTVQKIFYNNMNYEVSGQGYDPKGFITLEGKKVNVLQDIYLWKMLINGVVNNNANLIEEEVAIKNGTIKKFKVLGTPTEGSLLTLAKKGNINPQIERANYDVLKELSFSSERKRMSKIVKREGNIHCLSKGAPEQLLSICSKIVLNGSIVALTEEISSRIIFQMEKYAENGYRNLGFAFSPLDETLDMDEVTPELVEKDLIFLGLVALSDPPRKGVKKSVDLCNQAGMKVVMITGDHPITAKSIAKEVGIYQDGDKVYSGAEISQLAENEISNASVFARVAPEDKNEIVLKLQNQGFIVAMTGDGVNDAIALENADVGISMGITGTDVAKSASDIILTDDSFNTIERAIYHGRGLFNNIRSNTVFLLVCNIMEILILSSIYLIYQERLFSEWQLYFLYVLPHFFPPWGLIFDKYNEEIMKDPPKKKSESLINKKYLSMMVIQILIIGGVVFVLWIMIQQDIYGINPTNEIDVHVFNIFSGNEYDGWFASEGNTIKIEDLTDLELLTKKAQTMCFIVVVFSEIWIAFEARSVKKSMFKGEKNIALILLVSFVIVVLLLVLNWGLAQSYIGFINLSAFDWILAIFLSLLVVIISEIFKIIQK